MSLDEYEKLYPFEDSLSTAEYARGQESQETTSPPPTTSVSRTVTKQAGVEIPDSEWRQYAACLEIGPRIFYSPPYFERVDERKKREQRAKEICESCPVLNNCLEYAITHNEREGVWGGTTERERRRMFSRRSIN